MTFHTASCLIQNHVNINVPVATKGPLKFYQNKLIIITFIAGSIIIELPDEEKREALPITEMLILIFLDDCV